MSVDLNDLGIKHAKDVVVGDQVYGWIRTGHGSGVWGFLVVEKIEPIYHPLHTGDSREHRRLAYWRFEYRSLHLQRKPHDLLIVRPAV